jgi:hypothetical protein
MKPSSNPTKLRECPPTWKWIILILVAGHLVAVVAEPLRFFSQSDFQASPEFLAIRRWTAPYVEWLYLDHGYFFFAPNPGPSHLVAVSKESVQPQNTNQVAESGLQLDRFATVFPYRKKQWPRLLYHRYFMLSEFYNNTFAPDRLLPEDMADEEFVARWKRDRIRYEQLQNSLSNSLSHSSGAERVTLHRVERILLTPEQVLKQAWRLDDPRALVLLEESPRPLPPIGPVAPSGSLPMLGPLLPVSPTNSSNRDRTSSERGASREEGNPQ